MTAAIRDSLPPDVDAIEYVYSRAFPDENLLPLVGRLLKDRADVLSLVAVVESGIVGHVVLTVCGINGEEACAALLGPLAVDKAWQKQGIGSALVRAGLRELEATTVATVCVLGDPRYYSRLGFAPERNIEPPYSLPAEWQGAWQSLTLSARPGGGVLRVPAPWRDPALWAPQAR